MSKERFPYSQYDKESQYQSYKKNTYISRQDVRDFIKAYRLLINIAEVCPADLSHYLQTAKPLHKFAKYTERMTYWVEKEPNMLKAATSFAIDVGYDELFTKAFGPGVSLARRSIHLVGDNAGEVIDTYQPHALKAQRDAYDIAKNSKWSFKDYRDFRFNQELARDYSLNDLKMVQEISHLEHKFKEILINYKNKFIDGTGERFKEMFAGEFYIINPKAKAFFKAAFEILKPSFQTFVEYGGIAGINFILPGHQLMSSNNLYPIPEQTILYNTPQMNKFYEPETDSLAKIINQGTLQSFIEAVDNDLAKSYAPGFGNFKLPVDSLPTQDKETAQISEHYRRTLMPSVAKGAYDKTGGQVVIDPKHLTGQPLINPDRIRFDSTLIGVNFPRDPRNGPDIGVGVEPNSIEELLKVFVFRNSDERKRYYWNRYSTRIFKRMDKKLGKHYANFDRKIEESFTKLDNVENVEAYISTLGQGKLAVEKLLKHIDKHEPKSLNKDEFEGEKKLWLDVTNKEQFESLERKMNGLVDMVKPYQEGLQELPKEQLKSLLARMTYFTFSDEFANKNADKVIAAELEFVNAKTMQEKAQAAANIVGAMNACGLSNQEFYDLKHFYSVRANLDMVNLGKGLLQSVKSGGVDQEILSQFIAVAFERFEAKEFKLADLSVINKVALATKNSEITVLELEANIRFNNIDAAKDCLQRLGGTEVSDIYKEYSKNRIEFSEYSEARYGYLKASQALSLVSSVKRVFSAIFSASGSKTGNHNEFDVIYSALQRSPSVNKFETVYSVLNAFVQTGEFVMFSAAESAAAALSRFEINEDGALVKIDSNEIKSFGYADLVNIARFMQISGLSVEALGNILQAAGVKTEAITDIGRAIHSIGLGLHGVTDAVSAGANLFNGIKGVELPSNAMHMAWQSLPKSAFSVMSAGAYLTILLGKYNIINPSSALVTISAIALNDIQTNRVATALLALDAVELVGNLVFDVSVTNMLPTTVASLIPVIRWFVLVYTVVNTYDRYQQHQQRVRQEQRRIDTINRKFERFGDLFSRVNWNSEDKKQFDDLLKYYRREITQHLGELKSDNRLNILINILAVELRTTDPNFNNIFDRALGFSSDFETANKFWLTKNDEIVMSIMSQSLGQVRHGIEERLYNKNTISSLVDLILMPVEESSYSNRLHTFGRLLANTRSATFHRGIAFLYDPRWKYTRYQAVNYFHQYEYEKAEAIVNDVLDKHNTFWELVGSDRYNDEIKQLRSLKKYFDSLAAESYDFKKFLALKLVNLIPFLRSHPILFNSVNMAHDVLVAHKYLFGLGAEALQLDKLTKFSLYFSVLRSAVYLSSHLSYQYLDNETLNKNLVLVTFGMNSIDFTMLVASLRNGWGGQPFLLSSSNLASHLSLYLLNQFDKQHRFDGVRAFSTAFLNNPTKNILFYKMAVNGVLDYVKQNIKNGVLKRAIAGNGGFLNALVSLKRNGVFTIADKIIGGGTFSLVNTATWAIMLASLSYDGYFYYQAFQFDKKFMDMVKLISNNQLEDAKTKYSEICAAIQPFQANYTGYQRMDDIFYYLLNKVSGLDDKNAYYRSRNFQCDYYNNVILLNESESLAVYNNVINYIKTGPKEVDSVTAMLTLAYYALVGLSRSEGQFVVKFMVNKLVKFIAYNRNYSLNPNILMMQGILQVHLLANSAVAQQSLNQAMGIGGNTTNFLMLQCEIEQSYLAHEINDFNKMGFAEDYEGVKKKLTEIRAVDKRCLQNHNMTLQYENGIAFNRETVVTNIQKQISYINQIRKTYGYKELEQTMPEPFNQPQTSPASRLQPPLVFRYMAFAVNYLRGLLSQRESKLDASPQLSSNYVVHGGELVNLHEIPESHFSGSKQKAINTTFFSYCSEVPYERYSEENLITYQCHGEKGISYVFPKLTLNPLANSQPIMGDVYNRSTCRPIDFYGIPSVACEGEKTFVIHSPVVPSHMLDNIGANIALYRVLFEVGKNTLGWFKSKIFGSDKPKEVVVTDRVFFNSIFSQMKAALKSADDDIKKLQKKYTAKYFKDNFETYSSVLDDLHERVNELSGDFNFYKRVSHMKLTDLANDVFYFAGNGVEELACDVKEKSLLMSAKCLKQNKTSFFTSAHNHDNSQTKMILDRSNYKAIMSEVRVTEIKRIGF